MTLYVRTGRRSTSSGWNYGEASRVDRLRADGWENCPRCGGSEWGEGVDPSRVCPECAHGLVPPDGMVEAAAKAHWNMDDRNDWWDHEPDDVKASALAAMRTALVEGARWSVTK